MRCSLALLAALAVVAFAGPITKPDDEVIAAMVDARRSLKMSYHSMKRMKFIGPRYNREVKKMNDLLNLVTFAVIQKSDDAPLSHHLDLDLYQPPAVIPIYPDGHFGGRGDYRQGFISEGNPFLGSGPEFAAAPVSNPGFDDPERQFAWYY
uniref:Uncharacterized protein n=1 Tax=Steinernema glaseri TaxID=37863 RepID=A0A1I7ZRV7_9BILA